MLENILFLVIVGTFCTNSYAEYSIDEDTLLKSYCLEIEEPIDGIANFSFVEPVSYICRNERNDVKFTFQTRLKETSSQSNGTQLRLIMLNTSVCLGCTTSYTPYIGQLISPYFVDRFQNNLATFSRRAATKFNVSVDPVKNLLTLSFSDSDGQSEEIVMKVKLL